MKWLLRESVLLVVAAVLSWWLFLGWPAWAFADPVLLEESRAIAVLPELDLTKPPPPERGTPEGKESGEAGPKALMQDQELLARAKEETSGDAAKGFETVLLAAAEDQLDIARFFGEDLVLVPRSAIDKKNKDPYYFRLSKEGGPVVEQVRGRPPLPSYRQYRDLFDYEYARLPAPLRELRRSVMVRSEVYLFSALIPVAEWALVIARRRAALRQAGRKLQEARRFTLRYRRLAEGAFDVEVREILFRDGQRFRPQTF